MGVKCYRRMVAKCTYPSYPDKERLKQLAESKVRALNAFEFGYFLFHEPMRNKKDQRPFFPVFAVASEAESGYSYQKMFTDGCPSPTNRQEMLVTLLESLPFLPCELVVADVQTANLVYSVVTPLGIQVYLDSTPRVWGYEEDLVEHFSK